MDKDLEDALGWLDAAVGTGVLEHGGLADSIRAYVAQTREKYSSSQGPSEVLIDYLVGGNHPLDMVQLLWAMITPEQRTVLETEAAQSAELDKE